MSQKKIFSNTASQIAAKIFTALLSIFVIQMITRYLGVAGYGQYTKIYNYLSIFAVLADMGLYAVTVREISKYIHTPKEAEYIASSSLTLRSIMGGCIILLAPCLALLLPGYSSSIEITLIFIASIFTFFGLITSSQLGYLQAHLKTEYSFVSTTAGKIITAMLIF
jgi:O-antigen/teichoic acid export membrane protein